MAWNYGNKRWTLPFVSLNGTSCRVDIYQRGYTGSTVDTLTGADNFFEYAEDDDPDLLNGVIRYRTGYLRVIEESHGDLDDLYPLLNTDHYLEFYYGTTLDFNGFIQAQEFDNNWESGPRVIELPVISPLGLASGTYIDYTNYNPPRWVSFGYLLSYIFGVLDAPYTGYYFPKILSKSLSSGNVIDDLYVNSLTFCPFGTSYDKTDTMNGIYEPKTVGDVLTMICTTFGVILHDQPDRPIFQRVDYDDDYINLEFTSTRAVITPGTTDITAIASVASADNKESVIMPMSKIEVTYAGDENVPDMSFERCRGIQLVCAVDDHEFCANSPKISDFQGTFVFGTAAIDSAGRLTPYDAVALGAYGKDSLSEMIMYRPDSFSWANNTLIAKYTFFEWYERHQRLRFKFQFGDGIDNYHHVGTGPTIGIRVRRGNYMWSSNNNTWVSSDPSTETGYSKTWDGDYCNDNEDFDLSFALGNSLGVPNPLMIEFYAVSGHTYVYVYCISELRLEMFETASDAYLNRNQNPKTKTISGNPSDIDGSVERGYGLVAPTQNRIRYNDTHLTGTDLATLLDSEPTYPYLLHAQDRLQVSMKMTYQTAATLYLNKMTIWGSIGKWRVIARTFRPWDDEHVLTFHHSTVFDN